MCGGFTCSKNTLVGLNVMYILVSLLMIGVAVHSKVSGIVTSIPIVGGITASGVFLLFISVIGLIGAMKHHQVMLFIYMVVLFFIFIIQFSCSCAALSVSPDDQIKIIKTAWDTAEKSDYTADLIVSAERQFDCCGLGIYDNFTQYEHPNQDDHDWSKEKKVFEEDDKCFVPKEDCLTCLSTISTKVAAGFKAAGGLGLFFSFPELFGALIACRYRNLMDPFGASGTSFAS